MSSPNNRKPYKKKPYNKKPYNKKPYNKKPYNKNKPYNNRRNYTSYMVRISNLPHDITDFELKNLIRFDYTYDNDNTIRCNWNIGKCFIISNRYGYSGMIDFRFEDQAKYVVESLDKTPFANQILKVEILPPRPRR